jgi:hypothetical protein
MSVGLIRVLSHKYHHGFKPLMVLCFKGFMPDSHPAIPTGL